LTVQFQPQNSSSADTAGHGCYNKLPATMGTSEGFECPLQYAKNLRALVLMMQQITVSYHKLAGSVRSVLAQHAQNEMGL
jgi:hypothetical protein